ncbi:MAG: endonuclease/exonuclease/phosphatase family protein [Gammaproteobacteria bacterium]
MTQPFTLANFNVRNLVPASTKSIYHYFYSVGKHNFYSAIKKEHEKQSAYEKKIGWIASQLDQMNADVVCFQEIFDLQPLQDAINLSHYAGKCKLLMAGQAEPRETDFRGTPARVYKVPHVAIMVRSGFDVVDFEAISRMPEQCDISKTVVEESGRTWAIELNESGEQFNQFNRPVLKARIQLPDRFSRVKGEHRKAPVITVFSAHFKSKRPIQIDDFEGSTREVTAAYLRESAIGRARSLLLRAVEAAALRTCVIDELAEDPDRPVFVVGDLNDGPRSVTTEVSGGLTRPIFNHHFEPDNDKREEMFHISADLSLYSSYHLQTLRSHRDVYYTHIFDGHHDTLDHILVSSHFVPRWVRDGKGRDNIGKAGALRVYNDHLKDADIDDLRASNIGKYLHTRSDHGQVTLRLDWFEHKQRQ